MVLIEQAFVVKTDLVKEYEKFKLLLECPRLYICNYFNELRRKIDLAFADLNNQFESAHRTSYDLSRNWSKIILLIDSVEMKCLQSNKLNRFAFKFSCETNQKIKLIERLVKQISKEDDDYNCVLNLIYDEMYKIEKSIFQNQTLIFLDRKNCKLNRVFRLIDDDTSAGKLVFVKNEYFGKKSIKYLENPDAFSYNKLTNELVKCKELAKILGDTLNDNIIDEICLNYSQTIELNFSDSNIQTLDVKTLSGLTELTYINLSSNQISVADKELFNGLSYLTHLYLGYNNITKLEANLFVSLKNLTHLTLNNNKLELLTREAFAGLAKLKVIQLNYNHLEAIDEHTFASLPNLELIDLSNNKLKLLHKSLFLDQVNLKEINLANNQLDVIDSSLFSNQLDLTHLNLSSNSITHLDKNIFRSLHKLVVLRLDSNLLTSLDKQLFASLNELKELHLDSNRLQIIDKFQFKYLTHIEFIYLHNNRLKCLFVNTFDGLRSLKHLHLDSNQLKHIDAHTFKDLLNLEEIHLEYNQLVSLQNNFSKLYHRVNLRNFLNEQRTLFFGLNKLKFIFLNNNKLDTIDLNVFNEFKHLSLVDLSNNLFTAINRNEHSHLPIQWDS